MNSDFPDDVIGHDGLALLAQALAAASPRVECFLLGGEGARRAFARARSLGVRCAPQIGPAAASAARGAAARGARPWLFASGSSTAALAATIRGCARLGSAMVGLIPSHGDDAGDVLPLADGSDLHALAGAPCAVWTASNGGELRAFAERAAHGVESTVALAFDLRSVGLRRETSPSVALGGEGAVVRARREDGEGEHGTVAHPSSVTLLSSLAFAQAERAACWLVAEGVSARAARLGALDRVDVSSLRGALGSSDVVLLHDPGADATGERDLALDSCGILTALARSLAPPAARWIVARRAEDASDFCRSLTVPLGRAAREAGSRSLRIQLAGSPATRSQTAREVLTVLSWSGLDGWSELVEPSHALFSVDVGPAGAVGSSGWVLTAPGLPVTAPLDRAIDAGAMLVDVGTRSSLTCGEGASDDAALVVAAVLTELRTRGERAREASLLRAVERRATQDPTSRSWSEVPMRAEHLRSLR